MKVVLLGSRGHVTKPLTKILVSQGIETNVITRSEENAKLIKEDGATAAIGSNFDKEFLIHTFEGADSVFILLPANVFVADSLQQLMKQCDIACDAVLEADVKNVVYLSGIGSDNPNVGFHYYGEEIIKNKLGSLQSVALVRATGFFTNLFQHIPSIKSEGVIYSNSQRDQVETYVHPDDIAQVCADLIISPPRDEKFKIVGVESDSADASQIEQLFKDSLGLDVKWVSVSDEATLQTLTSVGVSEANAKALINLYSKEYRGEMMKSVKAHTNVIGTHKLSEFLKTEFVSIYNQNL